MNRSMKKRIPCLLYASLVILAIIIVLLFQNFSSGSQKYLTGKTQETGNRLWKNPADDQTPTKTEKKQIALTFDDGPDEIYTPMLLDGLRERDVHATFFLLGKQVEKYPDIVKRISNEGHLIGCHSYEHVNFNEIPEETACEQIRSTCSLIYDLTGIIPSFVRPPYGVWPSCLNEDFCMIPVLWNVDPLDWSTHDASLVTSRVLRKADEFDIILLHDASESSVQAAFQIIDILQKEDFEFVTVEELIMP